MPYADPEKQKRFQREWQAEKRARGMRLVRGLKANPCSDCGGRFPPEAMDFDHVRGEKHFNLARTRGQPDEVILAEIAKCDLVCANCHRVRTRKRLDE